MVASRREEYIEVIYEIVDQKGYARVKDVSQELGVGRSTVSEMFKKLDESGYVNYERYGGATLTDKGRKLAIKLSEKHEVLRDFLVILGLDDEVADDEACEIEHVVKHETMDRLTKFVEFIHRHENPLWLDRFKDFYETGELKECPKTIKKEEDQP